jgi:hypothetical protein
MRRAGVVLIVFVVLPAGCGAAGTTRAPAARYLSPPTVNCPAITGLARAEPLAAGFVPVVAGRCTFTLVVEGPVAESPVAESPVAESPAARQPGDKLKAPRGAGRAGRAGWEWVAVQRSSGPFDALVKALRAPAAAGTSTICPDVLNAPIVLTLTDAAGRTVMPALPATSCNRPDPAVQQAIDRLPWTTTARRPAGGGGTGPIR